MTPPPASTVLVRPEAASPLLSTVKPDPDALPTNLTEENRKDTTTPSLPRQKQESEQEQEEEKENNSSIDIADLADTVVNEEMTRYYNTIAAEPPLIATSGDWTSVGPTRGRPSVRRRRRTTARRRPM